MKTMILVINLPTRYQVTTRKHLRAVNPRQIFKDDPRVLTKVTPMPQGVRVDEGLLQDSLEDRSHSLVDIHLLWANSLGMVHHHRVDLVSPLDGNNNPHQISRTR